MMIYLAAKSTEYFKVIWEINCHIDLDNFNIINKGGSLIKWMQTLQLRSGLSNLAWN